MVFTICSNNTLSALPYSDDILQNICGIHFRLVIIQLLSDSRLGYPFFSMFYCLFYYFSKIHNILCIKIEQITLTQHLIPYSASTTTL